MLPQRAFVVAFLGVVFAAGFPASAQDGYIQVRLADESTQAQSSPVQGSQFPGTTFSMRPSVTTSPVGAGVQQLRVNISMSG